MSDKRSVATDALETLGTIIGEGAGRDAIHLAVEPVVAAEKLYSGEDVGLNAEGLATRSTDDLLGIVDPFLEGDVAAGERFWLVVYPRQITSLRHVWSHPQFPPAGERFYPASEKWIRDYAAKIGCTYDDLMLHAKIWAEREGKYDFDAYWCDGARWEGFNLSDDFWPHYENVSGTRVTEERRGSFFTCAC